jgi:hypothetical protein
MDAAVVLIQLVFFEQFNFIEVPVAARDGLAQDLARLLIGLDEERLKNWRLRRLQ